MDAYMHQARFILLAYKHIYEPEKIAVAIAYMKSYIRSMKFMMIFFQPKCSAALKAQYKFL